MFGLTEDDDLEEYLRQKADQPYQLDAGISDPAEAAAQSGGPAAGRDPYQEYLQMRQLMPRGQGATQLPEQDNTGALGAAGGAILDMVLNKGRGVGQIAAATAGNLSEQTNKRRQMEFELARQNSAKDPFQEYLAYANLAARQDDIANRGTNTAIRGNLLDPNSAQAQGQIQQAAAKAGATKGAALDATHVRADDIAEDAGLRSEQTALGRERADASFADAKRGRDVERAKEIAQAVGPVQTQNAVSRETALNPVRAQGAADRITATAQPTADAAVAKQDALRDDAADPEALKQKAAISEAGRKPDLAQSTDPLIIPGTHATPGYEKQYAATVGDPTRREKIVKALKATESGMQAIDDMIDLRGKEGYSMMGKTPTSLETSRKVIGGMIADAGAMGILQPSEWANIDTILPSSQFSKEDLYNIYNNHQFPGQAGGEGDVKVQQLMGLRDSLMSALKKGYGTYGITLGDAQQPSAAVAPPTAATSLQGTDPDGAMSDEPVGTTVLVEITSPKGNKIRREMTPQEMKGFPPGMLRVIQ